MGSDDMIQVIPTETIYEWLEEVKDPEIPVLSLIDLGVITSVRVNGETVNIEMTPTFVGCPALEYMKAEIVSVLASHGLDHVTIEVTYRKPWSSDLISERGKVALRKYGLAPPQNSQVFSDLEILSVAICPRCNGTQTELKTLFGSTLCRSIYYCTSCRESFEQFKTL